MSSAGASVSVSDTKQRFGGWVIAPQTKIFFVALVLIAITNVLLMMATGSFTPQSVFFFVYFVLTGIWGLIVVNCTVTGSCNLVAWIMSYVYLIISFFIVFASISLFYGRAIA